MLLLDAMDAMDVMDVMRLLSRSSLPGGIVTTDCCWELSVALALFVFDSLLKLTLTRILLPEANTSFDGRGSGVWVRRLRFFSLRGFSN